MNKKKAVPLQPAWEKKGYRGRRSPKRGEPRERRSGEFIEVMREWHNRGKKEREACIWKYRGYNFKREKKFMERRLEIDKRKKQRRAYGGCLGFPRRRRTWKAAKSSGDWQTRSDPEVSEWENPICWRHITPQGGQTQRTETSKYLQEEKEISISRVVASEMERA